MKRTHSTLLTVVVTLAAFATFATAATQTRTIKPAYVAPEELSRMLGVTETAGLGVLRWSTDGADHLVTVRRNDTANLLVLEGEADDLARVLAQAEIFDLPPRQIALEARIVEVDTDKARDLGIDWSRLTTSGNAQWDQLWSASHTRNTQISPSSGEVEVRGLSSQGADRLSANASLYNAISLLEEKGAATYRDTPRILTLNHRQATILDGARTTYVTRYAAYTNLFETETMDSGLRLEVTPSLGESGYLRLELRAELTSLTGSVSGSPVKTGQIVENTVMAKDGETVVLGGFTRTVDSKTRRRFPMLGTILPFLFSREIVTQRHHESLIVITPRVVDLAGKLDERDKGLLEGR